jgi:hypothetical protein
MDVIGFMCVTLGNSIVQLHAHARVQRLVSVVKMATVLDDVLLKSSVLLCVSCGQKGSMQRLFIKKNFLFTAGIACRVKRFTTVWQTFRWWRRGWNGGAEVATVKRLLCCGFRCTGKAIGQVYQCWWRICREVNVFFSGSNIACFTFYIHLLRIYWPSLLHSWRR